MGRPVLIAIDGFGAAGKTTFAKKLAEELGGCPVVQSDHFCFPPSGKEGEWWGPDVTGYGLDWERLRDEALIPAMNGKALQFEMMDWDDGTHKAAPVIEGNYSYIIVEGLGTLMLELRDYFAFKIWVDSELKTQMERVEGRDDEYMLPFWQKEFIPLAQAYYDEHKPRECADVIIDKGADPCVIAKVIIGRSKNDSNQNLTCQY